MQKRAAILFRDPKPGDIEHIVKHLRPADRAECAALGEYDVAGAIQRGLDSSVHSWVATANGEPALVMGVTPLGSLLADTGSPWMLGTHLVTKYGHALIRQSPAYIDQMLRAFPHLLNFVHAENTRAVRWLKRTGFVLSPAAPYGPHGALFHRFDMEATRV